MRRLALAALLVAGCAHAPVRPRAEAIDDAISESRKQVTDHMHKKGWTDVAVGVVLDGQLVYSEGFGVGDPATKEPVTPHTLFRIASLTKLFTGMAILQLRDAGKLDLDDPVSKYIPQIDGVVYPTTEHPPIRIRNLVTHTSGLPHDANRFSGMSADDLLAELHGLSLEFTPGSQESYSNLGMELAGMLIARLSGLPYEDYMRQNILEPLGMKESVWARSAATAPVARGMVWDKKLEGYRPVKEEVTPGALNAAGGLYSNVVDLAQFAAFELSAWPPSDAPERPPLSRSSLRESQLTAGPVIPERIQPGVNWFLQRNGSHGMLDFHMGLLDGYRSEIILASKGGLGIIVLGCQARTDDDFNAMTLAVLDAFAPLQRPEPPVPLSAPLRSSIERLVAWLEKANPSDASSVFSAAMITNNDRLLSDAAEARSRFGGACKVAEITPEAVTHATVRLTCERGEWTFSVRMQPSPPHLVDGWYWE
jgi:CubicO group peptidase (beta-lactamase class C family)